MDLTGWDASWGPLPSTTNNLIPPQTLWHYSCATNAPPQITAQPQSQTVSAGATVSFSVQASGSAPLSDCWYKNGLPLTDDTRITGSASSTLSIASVQSSDAGTYTARVSNPAGSVGSAGATLTVWTGAGGSNPGGIALIPAGSYVMGNCIENEGWGDELPLHTVYVSAFYMDKFDVTYALWQQVFNWATNHGYEFDNSGYGKAANHPVVEVNWYDSVKWCNARSEMVGLTPAYYTDASQTVVYRSGDLDISNACVNWNAGYRLPTEAEWENAARGGLSGQRFPWGNTINENQANYYSYDGYWNGSTPYYSVDVNSYSGYNTNFVTENMPYTSPVNYFAPNGYGLYDMAGNVCQWCWDWVGSYSSDFQSDPHGPTAGSNRVYRGGCWSLDIFYCRTAYRYSGWAVNVSDNTSLGFRSVLRLGQ
jgi:formylglycine-generating enzyme required for sulfatase activity